MEWVTQAEAARQLGLNRSTVSRWVSANPALLDDEGKVSVEQLREHREATLNPKLQTRASTRIADDDMSAPGQTAPAPRRSARRDSGPSLNDTRHRAETARATTAELDLAQRLGLTLRRDEVESAVAQAGEIMKQTAQQIIRDKAERLTRIEDVREMERALDDLMREILTAGSQALTLASQPAGSQNAA